MKRLILPFCLAAGFATGAIAHACEVTRGTGDLGVVVERGNGAVIIVDTSERLSLGRVEGLGDLSHASVVYSRDGRYAFVFGRDGGLSKVDVLCAVLAKRIVQAGNSIGGAISQDGALVAVSNYEPGGIRVFDSATLSLQHDIRASTSFGDSKVVGLVDAPMQRFVFSLYEAGAIWIADLGKSTPQLTKLQNIGRQPYDALITPDGRFYLAGLFGEDGLALVDLWHPEHGANRILSNYGRGEKPLPVYKMPHLEGWAIAGELAFVPAVGRHEVLVVNRRDWREHGRVAVHGQPVFVMAQPDGRAVWVNFAFPRNDTIQVIDTETLRVRHTLTPGKGVLHMEFTPRGEAVWLSVRDEDRVDVYDTRTYQRLGSVAVRKPSGIFFSARAHRIGL